jgi:hypothetical protein
MTGERPANVNVSAMDQFASLKNDKPIKAPVIMASSISVLSDLSVTLPLVILR